MANTLINISDRIMSGPFIDHNNAGYTEDFSYYYDSAMEAFDEFYRKYNLVLLKGNGRYQNFPDGRTHCLDFYSMEHAIGLSSFGQNDIIALDFMSDMLSNISYTVPNNSIKKDYLDQDKDNIEAIIQYWKDNKELNKTDYAYINKVLKKYKNVDDFSIQQNLLILSRIILSKAFSNKGNLLKNNPTLNGRREELINDLVYFIDNIPNSRIKHLLFNNNDFANKDNYDEKSLVIGYFNNYISSKFDINDNFGLNIGELIDEAKNRYYNFYTKQVILNLISTKPNNIKKTIKKYLEDSNNEYFNTIINKYINQDTLVSVINKNNIGFYLKQFDRDDLDINNMIILNNTIKNLDLDDMISKNDEEILNLGIKLEEINELCNKLIEEYRNTYNSDLNINEFMNYISPMIRNNNIDENNNLYKLIDIIKKKNKLEQKINALEKYSSQLNQLKSKSTNYSDKIKTNIINSLNDYTNDDLDINNNTFIRDFICDLINKNYYDIVVREIQARNIYPNNNSHNTNFLEGIINTGKTNSMKLIIHNDRHEMSTIFDNLSGYDSNDNDYDNALKLVSEISDNYAVNLAISLRSMGYNLRSIINKFKSHTYSVGLIHLMHGLMKNPGVINLLHDKFSKQEVSINYEKLMYKCYSMVSIDEVITSRVKVYKTVSEIDFKGISLTPIEEIEIRDAISRIKCPYIMVLGGQGDIKTIVYLAKDNNTDTFIPLHSIRYETDNGISAMLTREEILHDGKYMPERRRSNISAGIILQAGDARTISKER